MSQCSNFTLAKHITSTDLIESLQVGPAQVSTALGTLDILHLVLACSQMGQTDFAHSAADQRLNSEIL